MQVWVCGVDDSGARSLVQALGDIEATIIRSAAIPQHLPDACILVASAEQGFSPAITDAWHRCAEDFIPRICVWTHIDSGRADDDEMRAMAERVLEEDVFPLALPICGDDDEFVAVLDLPAQQIHLAHEPARPADAEHVSLSAPMRDELMEAAAATTDDSRIIEQLNLGLTIDGDRAWDLITAAVRSGQLAVAVPTRPIEPHIGITVLQRLLSQLS